MKSKWPIGVFTSIDTGLGAKLEVARELGVSTVQLHAPAAASRTPAAARQFLATLADLGIEITAMFGGFEGESYADIPTVARTVGLVPPTTRQARLKEMKAIADFARLLEVNVIGLHLGFVPHNAADPLYREVLVVTRDLCDHCRRNGQNVHLETGQEPADCLLRFLSDMERDNLFVNFDPANMILYGSGEPIAALEQLGSLVRSVHCKDGRWAANPGKEWGTEMPLGQGDVGMENYLRTLLKIGYDGPLTIEREIPQEAERQKAEIGQAITLLNELKKKLGV
ncbi:MAG TPA: sugar phosphate isomerase/epimerase family protein [Pirellulales bacterium]|nr:sugar phosphate isomerase/epimerase family protein [Pirellulales bacterium]